MSSRVNGNGRRAGPGSGAIMTSVGRVRPGPLAMINPTLSLTVLVPEPLVDLVSAWLFEAGVAGVEEQEPDEDGRVGLVLYSTDEAELAGVEAHLTRARAALAARGEPVEPFTVTRGTVAVDWEAEWLRHLRPAPLGDGFVATPVDGAAPLPRERRPLWFRPAWAFGDGTHATTQLAAAAVERAVRARPGASLLDVGTGSGVLALLGRAAGAGRTLGIDVDPKAVAAARENAALNPDAGAVELETTPLADVTGWFDVVVANITESTLFELAPELARVTAPGGRLIVTGLVAGDTTRLEDRLAEAGLCRRALKEQAEWVLLELERA